MVRIVLRLLFLMEGSNCSGYKIHIHDVDFVVRTKRQNRQSCEKNEGSDHVELRRLTTPTVPQNNTWAEDSDRDFGQELPDHVLAKFLGARVGIIVRAIPLNRSILGDDFVLAFAGNGNGAHMTETPHTMVVMHAHGKL